MTIDALSKFHNSVVGSPPYPTRVLLKLIYSNGKPTLTAVQEPINYIQKIFHWVDLFLNKNDYKLSTIANFLNSQEFTDRRSKIYLTSLNKKIKKHNDKQPHDPVELVKIHDIAKKRLVRRNTTSSTALNKPKPTPRPQPKEEPSSQANSEDPRIADALQISKESENEELIAIADTPITRLTMQRMKDEKLLNDELINAYMELINKRSATNSSLPKVYCVNTFFLNKLAPKGDYCYENVKRWLKNIDLFSYDLIMVPVNVNNNHWCLAVINLKQEKLEYYDSLQLGDTGQILEHLRRWLKDRIEGSESKPKLDPDHLTKDIHTDIPLQTNAIDCGVFTCQYANSLARGSTLEFRQSQIPAMRRQMIVDFLDGAIQ